MSLAICSDQPPIPPPSYHRRPTRALYVNAAGAVPRGRAPRPAALSAAAASGSGWGTTSLSRRVLWSAVETRVALTYAVVWVIALAAWQARRPDLIRSPRLALAHVWEGMEM